MINALLPFPWEKALWSFVFSKDILWIAGKFFGQYDDLYFCQEFLLRMYKDNISFTKKTNQKKFPPILRKEKISLQCLYGFYKKKNMNFSMFKNIPQELYSNPNRILFLRNPRIQGDIFQFSSDFFVFYPDSPLMDIQYPQGEKKIFWKHKSHKTQKQKEKNLHFFSQKITIKPQYISFSGITTLSIK